MLRFHTLRRVRTPADVARLEKVLEFHRHEFPSAAKHGEAMRQKLMRPLKVGYAAVLVTAEELDGTLLGFAFYDHFPDLDLSYLEYIVTAPGQRSRGVGGALYEAVRESLLADGSHGLLFEVNADDPDLEAEWLAGVRATLKFYEKYDARPLDGVRFDYPPFEGRPRLLLVYDPLGTGRELDGRTARAFMRKLYEVKYGANAKDAGAQAVVAAVPEGPLPRRPHRFVKPEKTAPKPVPGAHVVRVEAIVSEAHRVHAVPERDYLERPLRMARLVDALRKLPFVTFREPRKWPDRHLLEVHEPRMVRYLRNASAHLGENDIIYPTVFPVRRRIPGPGGQPNHAGYYSLDSFTPLTRHAYTAARAAVDVALTAADRLRSGVPQEAVYALTRPPGHHAERDLFGGFCYFNNGAVAAHHLSADGRVALLDVDFHHGNGAQQIFWTRDDVLTVSVHGDPRSAYPYFMGFAHERGEGAGAGCNWNFPLPEGTGDAEWLRALAKALKRVQEFEPDWLVVALGLDVSKDDPSGFFRVTHAGFQRAGRAIAELGLPTMFTQEGGYNLRHLGGNLRAFLQGWSEGRG